MCEHFILLELNATNDAYIFLCSRYIFVIDN